MRLRKEAMATSQSSERLATNDGHFDDANVDLSLLSLQEYDEPVRRSLPSFVRSPRRVVAPAVLSNECCPGCDALGDDERWSLDLGFRSAVDYSQLALPCAPRETMSWLSGLLCAKHFHTLSDAQKVTARPVLDFLHIIKLTSGSFQIMFSSAYGTSKCECELNVTLDQRSGGSILKVRPSKVSLCSRFCCWIACLMSRWITASGIMGCRTSHLPSCATRFGVPSFSRRRSSIWLVALWSTSCWRRM